MIARFFQKSEPISFISLLILLFLHIIFYRISTVPTFSFDTFLQIIFTFIFFAGILFLVDFIIYKNSLTPNNYYAIFVFVNLFGFFPTIGIISKISIAHLFSLMALRYFYSLRNKKNTLTKLFNSGFYLGVAFLFYPNTALYLLLFYTGYFIYVRIASKNLVLPILGFITPTFLLYTYAITFNDFHSFRNLLEINILFTSNKLTNTQLLIPLISIGLLIMATLVKNIRIKNLLDYKSKKSIDLIVLQLILSLIMIAITTKDIEQNIQFLFFPVAILIGNLLSSINKWWVKDLIFYGFLLFPLLMILF